jgi:hypothetical protein
MPTVTATKNHWACQKRFTKKTRREGVGAGGVAFLQNFAKKPDGVCFNNLGV